MYHAKRRRIPTLFVFASGASRRAEHPTSNYPLAAPKEPNAEVRGVMPALTMRWGTRGFKQNAQYAERGHPVMTPNP